MKNAINKIVDELDLPIRLKKECKEYYNDSIEKTDKNYYIYGNSGTGKTIQALTLLLQIAVHNFPKNNDSLLKYDFFAFFEYGYLNVPEFLFNLRNAYSSRNAEEYINKYKETAYLVLDDIGTEKQTDWTHEILYLLVNHRYNTYKTTIATSNLSPEELRKKLKDDRIISRLLFNATVLHKTKNYRNK